MTSVDPASLPRDVAAAKAFVFDAYGTLLDVHSAVARHAPRLGDKAAAVSQLWRSKQLEYSWLRSLMQQYVPFWQITCDALAVALASHGVDDPALAEDLQRAYLALTPYPEVWPVLDGLRTAGRRCAILTNGSAAMIDASVRSAGLTQRLDAVLSVDAVEVFKPDPRVYQLACDRLGLVPAEIAFFSSNAWDVAGAAHFGFQVCWVNRFGQVAERLPGAPRAVWQTLDPLRAIRPA